MTKIEWTDTVWNVVTGCTKIASGCKHCYAARMANRLRGRCGYPADDPFRVTLHPDRLEQPLRWRKPRTVFVNSMGDLFHEDVPDGFIFWVWYTIARTVGRGHVFQILTKRPNRMREWFTKLDDAIEPDYRERCGDRIAILAHGPDEIRKEHSCGRALLFADMLEMWGYPPYGSAYPTYDWADGLIGWPTVLPNLWLGTSASAQKDLDANVPLLLNTPAAVRFVSLEPLLGPIDLVDMIGPYSATDGTALMGDGRNRGLDWVIVGCESGPHARPMDEDWVRSIRDQCQSAGVKFFYKQRLDGGKKISLPVLDGCTWDQMPEVKW